MLTNLLSAADLADFATNGFLGPYTLMTSDEITPLRERLQTAIDRESGEETIASQVTPHAGEGGPLRTLYDRHLTDPDVFALAAHPGIVSRARQLLSENLLLWRSTFWIKQPFSRRLEWHQDTYKDEGFGSFPNLNAWIAIDEATEANGVRLAAGTHKSIIDRAQFRTAEFMALLESSDDLPPPPIPSDVKIVTMAVKPGQCFLFDGRVLHGSPPNRSPQRRAGMVARFIAVGTRLSGLKSPCILVSGQNDAPTTGEPPV